MLGGHPDYFRAKVLQALPTQDGVMLEVFAVDYGCTNVVPLDSVSRLTQLRRKEPYQVRPSLLENSNAICLMTTRCVCILTHDTPSADRHTPCRQFPCGRKPRCP